MAKIYTDSEDADVNQLDFFSTPATNASIKKKRFVIYNPVSGITPNTRCIHFQIKPSSQYLSLPESLLWMRVKIRDKNGYAPTKDDNVWIINHFLRSMWKQVEVFIGGKLITPGTANFHFKAFIKALMYAVKTYGEKAKLSAAMFAEDTPGAHDTLNGDEDSFSNQGALTRHDIVKTGHSIEMEGTLGEDALEIPKLFLNGVPIDIKLYVNDKETILMADQVEREWKVEIEDCHMKMCHAEVSSGVIKAHAESLAKKILARYFFTQAVMNNYTMGSGQRTFSQTIFQGKVPQKIVVAMVDSDRYMGDYTKNPFKFHHFDVSNMAVLVNDVSTPARPLEMDFSKRHFAHAVNCLLQDNPNVIINHHSFDKGYALFVFDINSSINEDELPLQEGGTVRLEMQFDKAPSKAIQILVYGEFQSLLEVDEHRSVIYNPL